MNIKREDIIREVESMLDHGGYQIAKAIVRLSSQPPGTVRMIGDKGKKKSMGQSEAKAMVDAATKRIELVESTS